MPMNDGDRHAATNVDFNESEAVWPACIAAWKCDVRIDLACAARDPWLSTLDVEPRFRGLRSDPRYARLVERLHLTPRLVPS